MARLLLALLMVGIIGTIPELVMLNHMEDWKQWIPLVLLGAGLPLAWWHARHPGAASVRALRWLGVAYVVSGALGTWFHLRGNLEFQRELDPAAHGWPLWRETLTHGAPALAPGTMIWFGLLAMLLTLAGTTASRDVPAPSQE